MLTMHRRGSGLLFYQAFNGLVPGLTCKETLP